MIKTIEISGRDVQFDTSLSWMLLYRTQFGSDPIDIVMPAIKAAIPLCNRAGEEFTEDDYDLLTDVLSEISLTEGLQLIWSLARNADRKIDDPANWYHRFENFPLDDVLSEIVPALVESCISTKKFKALSETVKKAVPKKK